MTLAVSVREAHKNDRSVICDWYQEKVRQILFPKKRADTSKINSWYNSQLESSDNLIIIGIVDIIRFGAVYFKQLSCGEYEAFMMIKSHYCMKGLHPKLLSAAIKLLQEKRTVSKIIMQIPDVNPASQYIWEREGFCLNSDSAKRLRWEAVF
jgi:hypothetical protein